MRPHLQYQGLGYGKPQFSADLPNFNSAEAFERASNSHIIKLSRMVSNGHDALLRENDAQIAIVVFFGIAQRIPNNAAHGDFIQLTPNLGISHGYDMVNPFKIPWWAATLSSSASFGDICSKLSCCLENEAIEHWNSLSASGCNAQTLSEMVRRCLLTGSEASSLSKGSIYP
ncbi:MAG: hypothetical protein LBU32_10995 [Clostridiales bacterium]|jgi:hypothetical protein|nr:hypothetical protein [Clostridiales bacterium]